MGYDGFGKGVSNCTHCDSRRLLEVTHHDSEYNESRLVNEDITLHWSEFESFTVCLDCGQLQKDFPYEELDAEKAVRKVHAGDYDSLDLEQEDYEIWDKHPELNAGWEDIKPLIRKRQGGMHMIFEIEDHSGTGVAYINSKKKFYENDEFNTSEFVYCEQLDDSRELKQIKKAMFVLYKGKNTYGSADELREKLQKLENFNEIVEIKESEIG